MLECIKAVIRTIQYDLYSHNELISHSSNYTNS